MSSWTPASARVEAMMTSDFETIVAALDAAGAYHLVVGGGAIVQHGVSRLTANLDLAIDLEAGNAHSPGATPKASDSATNRSST